MSHLLNPVPDYLIAKRYAGFLPIIRSEGNPSVESDGLWIHTYLSSPYLAQLSYKSQIVMSTVMHWIYTYSGLFCFFCIPLDQCLFPLVAPSSFLRLKGSVQNVFRRSCLIVILLNVCATSLGMSLHLSNPFMSGSNEVAVSIWLFCRTRVRIQGKHLLWV